MEAFAVIPSVGILITAGAINVVFSGPETPPVCTFADYSLHPCTVLAQHRSSQQQAIMLLACKVSGVWRMFWLHVSECRPAAPRQAVGLAGCMNLEGLQRHQLLIAVDRVGLPRAAPSVSDLAACVYHGIDCQLVATSRLPLWVARVA
jgi:hypothetical protein